MSAGAQQDSGSGYPGELGRPPAGSPGRGQMELSIDGEDSGEPMPARHILRSRTVRWFREHPYAPGGAIPRAVYNVIGGPMMWSDRAITARQFSMQQRELLLRAYEEIKDLHAAAGGGPRGNVRFLEGTGYMPADSSKWPYQSEEWAAECALNTGHRMRRPSDKMSPEDRLDAELGQAFYAVTTWIDHVRDGLLDASAVYDDEEED
jgi:hypothetical protein